VPAPTTAQLEGSFLDGLKERLGAPEQGGEAPAPALAVDEPGLLFRAKGRDRWVEPRLSAVEPLEFGTAGTQDEVVWVVRCFAKVEAKGERRLTLSGVVDAVRAALDPRRGAPAMSVLDEETKAVVGVLQFRGIAESRAYNQTAQVRGDSLPGLDVATLTVASLLDSGSCG
jgi:hypothetical protein